MVLALPCRLNPSARSRSPTVSALTRWPWRVSSAASFRVDLVVHRSGDTGSPLSSGSTRPSSAGTSPRSRSAARLRPPPARPAPPPPAPPPPPPRPPPPPHPPPPPPPRPPPPPPRPAPHPAPAMPQRPRLSAQQQPPLPLIQMRQDRPELRRQHLPAHHAVHSTP